MVSKESNNKNQLQSIGYCSPFFLTFIDAIPDIIGVQDSNHNILQYNKAGYEFLNLTPEQVQGKKCYELIGRTRICDNCATEHTYKTRLPSHITRFFPDLNIWFDIRSFPVLNEKGEIDYIIEHLRDITLQKQMEDELKQARNNLMEKTRFLENLIQNQPGMVYRCRNDHDWTMEYIGGQCEELTGYKKEDLINNRNVSFNFLIAKEYRDLLWEKWQRLLANGDVFQDVYEIVTADGKRKWVWEQGSGVYDLEGKVLALEGIIMDISQLKKAELDLKEKNEEILRSNDALKAAKEQAEEADKLKSAFLANVSHEIRTPLNGIIGFAELIARKELSKEKKDQYLEIIKQSGNHLLKFINDLIEISKIETGQVEITEQSVYLPSFLDDVISFFRHQISSPTVRIIKGESDDITLSTDEGKLRQIMNNLLSNAVKFTAKGTIEAGVRKKGNFAEFYVSDTGLGIEPGDKDTIFDRFVQGRNTKKIGNKGTGLGLAIAKNHTELLGGTIGFESEPGKGSTFRFTLPLQGK